MPHLKKHLRGLWGLRCLVWQSPDSCDARLQPPNLRLERFRDCTRGFLDSSSDLGPLALWGSRAFAGGLAIEHTLYLACKVPCLHIGSMRSTVLGECLLVGFLDRTFALLLCLGSCLDGNFDLLGSLLKSTLGLGPGGDSRFVAGLRSRVRSGGVERIAFALGDGVLVVLLGLRLGLHGNLDSSLAAARAVGAIRQTVDDLLAFVGIGLDLFAGVSDELATVFVALACRSHLVDGLLGFGEFIIKSEQVFLRHNVIRRGRSRVDYGEGKGNDGTAHFY